MQSYRINRMHPGGWSRKIIGFVVACGSPKVDLAQVGTKQWRSRGLHPLASHVRRVRPECVAKVLDFADRAVSFQI